MFDDCTPHSNMQQLRRRPSVPFAPHVPPSVNPAKPVAVVVVALGSEGAEVLATGRLITRGTRASGPAKRGASPRQ